MYIQVSKTFTNYLNKQYKSAGFTFYYVEMSPAAYEFHVNYNAAIENENDYKNDRNKYAVIMLKYPPEYYAMPFYITTTFLNKVCKEARQCYGAGDELIESNFLEVLQDYIFI